ncbi:hypothetical protein H109_00936 [Trichophyton interdigitale MR816]|uniref:CNH domain-containing protein n=1 Tax=Trichophyton interdigitale (strain MR816) TaxID=1215338 RepID=A0A059JHD0_TRIIM|nr:hypothetical protein H101_02860 [Trichophyton interdigitale H6]KDB27260.1 hypothetical protein H109_00936 [Trichophyton interdigitale MR816]
MGSDGDIDPRRKRRRISPPETGPYVLRSLLEDVPVQAEDGEGQAHITCVEYWNENLYVGTSAGEILHFVSLPPESELEAGNPSFILASRQPITSSARTATSCGIQQILVLATASKACVLCNGSVFFYSLPELSPAYGTTKVANCNWIGGLDLDEPDAEDGEEASDPIIMLGMQDKIMLVRIGEGPRRVRNIEFPGCLIANRRGTIACVADSRSYALLEVEHRQKIPLFPISSNDEYDEFKVEDIPSRSESPARDKLPVASNGNSGVKTHGRSTSLNAIAASSDLRQQSTQPDVSGTSTPSSLAEGNLPKPTSPHDRRLSIPSRSPSAAPGDGLGQKPLPPTPSPTPKKTISMLKPHIVSPTPSEFLLVTGTDASNPAVGMFVNLEGETAERGTIEFQTYPDAIVLDNGDEDPNSHPSGNDADGYVLAVVNAAIDTEAGGEVVEEKCLEVQRWDVNPGEGGRQRSLINVSLEPPVSGPVGIARTVSPNKINFADVGELLQVVRLKVPDLRTPGSTTPQKNNDPRTEASIEQLQKEKELFENDSDSSKQVKLRRGWEAERNAEELAFAKTLGYVKSNVMLWEGNQIWRVLRNPLALQLENALTLTQEVQDARTCRIADKGAIIDMMARLDSILPRTAPESLGLNYVKQKASLLLFGDLIATNPEYQTPSAIKSVEDVLIAGELDPRIILLFTPLLREEILQGPQGIWICAGLTKVVDTLLEVSKDQDGTIKFNFTEPILRMLVRYLTSWHRKRGYGSVTDDTYVFDSVDSALLRLLLHLDATHNEAVNGKTVASDVRQELNKLVDNWKGNFTRAVELLELYQRLFVLSRLYQSRKMSGHVLRTWRRTIEGEKDVGGEMTIPAVELQVRKYLMKIRDPNLVEEYGLWLAARNPKLGIQVFSDDSSRVQFDPPQVIRILKDRAPGAVQVYLEHLVFTKNITRYADDLISYYLDTVISVLETSPEARASLTESYSTYRALRPPKPSYLSFITENAPPEPWWQSRLRLLQLLGGVARSQFTSAASLPSDLPYSISAVLERIEPFKNELVSECIILGGRQGRHDDALHLLTHGLGDYDSAIRYCLFEGSGASASHSMFSRKFSPSEGQKQLFAGLLREFLHIADPSERTERTGDLLARFAPLFDVREVLDLVPDEWSVDALSEYFARALRDLTSESRNAKVQRALSAGLNLKVCADFIKESEKIGGWIEDASEVKPLKGDKDITAEPEPHAEDAAKNNQSPNEAGTQIRPDDTLKIS